MNIEKQKYYWIVYSYTNAGGGRTDDQMAINMHPFLYLLKHKEDAAEHNCRPNFFLHNWKEITEKEYWDFFKMIQ